MSAQAETQGSALDSAKLLLAALIVAGGIGAFYYFGDASQLLRVLGLLVLVGIAAAIALTTALGRGLMHFSREANIERRKVVWPTRQETIQTTLIVIVAVLILGVFLWLVDMVLLNVVKALTGQGG